MTHPTRVIHHLEQPHGTNLCGQTCVAMAAGITLEESITLCGSQGRMQTKQLLGVLAGFGLEGKTSRMQKWNKKDEAPPFAILRMKIDPIYAHDPKKGWIHWVLMWNGKLHDPSLSYAGPLASNRERLVSWMELVSHE